jgi:CDGSH-type Zn-finger protein
MNNTKEKKPRESIIKVTKDGPLLVMNLENLRNSNGEFIENRGTYALCRCGGSNNMPFCDGAHTKIGFRGEKLDDREPDRLDTYEGQDIIIHDNRGVCSHIGHCTNNAPKVFSEVEEPWIIPDGDKPEHTTKVIRTCPSGALSYTKEGKLYKNYPHPEEIFVGYNRSYYVIGGIQLDDPDGNKPETMDHYCLCRCGGSSNKPFCDGTHLNNDFDDPKN